MYTQGIHAAEYTHRVSSFLRVALSMCQQLTTTSNIRDVLTRSAAQRTQHADNHIDSWTLL